AACGSVPARVLTAAQRARGARCGCGASARGGSRRAGGAAHADGRAAPPASGWPSTEYRSCGRECGGLMSILPLRDERARKLPLDCGLEPRAAEFDEILRRQTHASHGVAMQDYPDPDAIEGAHAYRMFAAQHDITADSQSEGRTSHQQNLALTQLVDTEMTRYTE